MLAATVIAHAVLSSRHGSDESSALVETLVDTGDFPDDARRKQHRRSDNQS
jgi:hypothetical protein